MRFQGLAEPPTTAPRISPTRVIGLIGATLALAYVVVLSGSYFTGDWLVNAQGQPIAGDFVNVWAAGRLTLDGHSAAAYDWTQHKAMEVQAVGHTFDDYYGWHYPPPFLFVAAALALMPFLPASIIWLATTLPLYVAALRAIVATLLATPYLYIYDLVVLAVPVAFLLRLDLARGFLVSEIFGLAAGGILLLIYPYVATHVGFAATLIVGVLILQQIKVETIAR